MKIRYQSNWRMFAKVDTSSRIEFRSVFPVYVEKIKSFHTPYDASYVMNVINFFVIVLFWVFQES